jgi:hypothetical protein
MINWMKNKLVFASIVLLSQLAISYKLTGQIIHGIVIDSQTELPLVFVNVGVINIPIGAITNESGDYQLNCENLPEDSKIRISMIGYESQNFCIQELLKEKRLIRLIKKPIDLDEVIVSGNNKFRKIGTFKTSNFGEFWGWGGTFIGKGHERGLFLDLGSRNVKVEDINVEIHKHSFDTVFFRIHIRSVKNGLPFEELLTENIYFFIDKKRGWQKIDLKDYNIVAKDSIALTIEWIKASNVIEKNLIKMNGSKEPSPNILFNLNKRNGTFLIRHGSEAEWLILQNRSPGIFITVKE